MDKKLGALAARLGVAFSPERELPSQ